jgi:capsular polysaccharide biosynthesis protein
VEIVDFLHVARRRIAVLIVIPLLAAAAAAAMVLLAPPSYTATTTVWAPALVGGAAGNQYTGSQAVSQFASAFQATAMSPAVRQVVSDRTGVDRNEIASNLTVAQVGASSSMTLTYTDTTDKYVAPVLTELTKETLSTMFGSQVRLAEAQVAAATKDVSTANAAIATWEQKANMVDPKQVYQARIDQINSLLQQQSTLRANGSTTAAAAVGASIASLRATLTSFSAKLAEYTTLTAARDAAAASLTQSQQSLLSARTQLSAADPATVSFTGKVHRVSEAPILLSKVLPVVGAGVFLAVVLVAMLELLARSRAARTNRSTTGVNDGGRSRTTTGYGSPEPPADTDELSPATGRHVDSDLVTSRE